MSDLFAKLKRMQPARRVVDYGGLSFLVQGISQMDKNSIMAECTSSKTGRLDGGKAEQRLLAACVRDPKTEELVQPDYREWDIAADAAAPLIRAVIQVCNLDEDEVDELVKKFTDPPTCD